MIDFTASVRTHVDYNSLIEFITTHKSCEQYHRTVDYIWGPLNETYDFQFHLCLTHNVGVALIL
jgi:hypothetical protein